MKLETYNDNEKYLKSLRENVQNHWKYKLFPKIDELSKKGISSLSIKLSYNDYLDCYYNNNAPLPSLLREYKPNFRPYVKFLTFYSKYYLKISW